MDVLKIEIKSETEDTVTVSRESWNELMNLVRDKKAFSSRDVLTRFSGKIKMTVDPLEYQKAIRDEWR